jgi:hypothetical protein
MKISVFSAIIALSVASVGTAFAATGDGSVPGGYVYPNWWFGLPAQQQPVTTNREQASGPSTGAYVTRSMPVRHGTYLFLPDPWK